MTKQFIIAVDGQAGAGKGTLAKSLARALHLPYMDTGKLYRAIAAISLATGEAPLEVAQNLRLQDTQRGDLRDDAVTKRASEVAKDPQIRAALIDVQRRFARQRGAVLDGRDIGTVIFPDAEVKFFLTASPHIRAQRRFLQMGGDLKQEDAGAKIARIENEITQRDRQDENRQTAPLKAAHDAYQMCTDHEDIQSVLRKALTIIEDKTHH